MTHQHDSSSTPAQDSAVDLSTGEPQAHPIVLVLIGLSGWLLWVWIAEAAGGRGELPGARLRTFLQGAFGVSISGIVVWSINAIGGSTYRHVAWACHGFGSAVVTTFWLGLATQDIFSTSMPITFGVMGIIGAVLVMQWVSAIGVVLWILSDLRRDSRIIDAVVMFACNSAVVASFVI